MDAINLIILGGYFLFVILAAVIFRRFSSTASGFIRGSGGMMWWMAGATAFMTQFSAWTFTGAAAKAYEDGLTVLFIFWGNALGFFVAAWYFAARFRKLRVDTAMEVIRQRFGRMSEQMFTWIQFPLSTVSASIWLNGLALFVAAVMGIDLNVTIIGVGVLVTLIAVSGGSWTVSATNTIQLIMLMSITMVAGFYALIYAGGPANIARDFPVNPVMGDTIQYWQIFVVWVVALMMKQTIGINNAMTCFRFLVTVNEREAKKAALLTGALFIVGPVMWFVPPWVTATMNIDLASYYPNLGDGANSAAYLYFIEHHMPQGVLGLVLAAMTAATISPMSTALNRNAGIFVKNVYQSLINPAATDRQQLMVGKAITLANGFIATVAALLFASMEGLSFFDLMMMFGALMQMPMAMPALLSIIVTRTPDWSGWATLVVGLLVSCFMQFVFDANWLLPLFSAEAFTAREAMDLKVIAALIAHVVITGGFFVSTSFFYKKENTARSRELSKFRMNMRRAIRVKEEAELDTRQGTYLGKLTQVLGVVAAALVLVPDTMTERLAFAAIGLLIVISGYGLQQKPKEATV